MFLINLLNSVNISAVVTVAAAEERVLHYYRMVHGIMIMKSKFLHALWSFLPFSSSSSKQRHRSSTPIHIPNNTTINTPISTPANFRWVMMISIEWRYSLQSHFIQALRLLNPIEQQQLFYSIKMHAAIFMDRSDANPDIVNTINTNHQHYQSTLQKIPKTCCILIDDFSIIA